MMLIFVAMVVVAVVTAIIAFRSFLKDLKKLREPIKRYNVERALITITLKRDEEPINGKHIIDLVYDGYIEDDPFYHDGATVTTAHDLFWNWRKCGRFGTLSIGDQTYIPLSHVATITVIYSDLWVKKED